MALFCDVALPVPLDRLFTYQAGEQQPVAGARVLVPFGSQRMMGVVVRVHDTAPGPEVEVKPIQSVLDPEGLLPPEMMKLASWVAEYYCAPLGEVLRGMLPLSAELRRQFLYRIAEAGRRVLYEGAQKGSSRRSRLSPEEQNREYAVLNYLESGEAAKPAALRSATGANRHLLEGMVKKKWLVREVLAEERDARRMVRVAVLVADARLPKLNANQTAILAELAAAGGRMRLRDLREQTGRAGVPASTVQTLVSRGLVRLEEEAETFRAGGLAGAGRLGETVLNEAQMEALGTIVAAMDKGGFRPHLLFGVTGSGKTAVYLAAMRRALDRGLTCMLLVPEIGLTPAMAGLMFAEFGTDMALLHSALTPDERAGQWHRIRRGEARIVVGTRSAVFAPMPAPGLILVDEEHDASYKQEETPRYHGRDVAVIRAKLSGAVVVLGSATPSLESWSNAQRGRYALIEMRRRVMDRPLPAVELIDMRDEFRAQGREEIFSRTLVERTRDTIARGEQVILLLNRRGYSSTVLCRSCGERIECENCALAMTFHRAVDRSGHRSGEGDPLADANAVPGQRLECHVCGFRRRVPELCPHCASEHLYFFGAGSQQAEEKLLELFPEACIGRMDRDTVRGRNDMERLLQRLHTGEINLLVGTQMIAKGHDIHGVTLVGVIGADYALGMPDFRAAERVFQLLTQVAGRAGRGELPGTVLVQSYHPDHYAVKFAAAHDYPGFATKEMQFRRSLHYPPFAVLANVVLVSEKLEEAAGFAAQIGRWFERTRPVGLRVLGPAAAPVVRLKRIFRFHFILKAERRSVLGEALRGMIAFATEANIPRRNLIVDVDAVQLM